MGIFSTTRTVVYCMAAVIATGCVGFTVNAYMLYLLNKSVERVEAELAKLRSELVQADSKESRDVTDTSCDVINISRDVTSTSRNVTSTSREVSCEKTSESDSEEEFQLALESIPSQSILAHGTDTQCTDRECSSELLALCQALDDEHDTLKQTEQGCEQGLLKLRDLNEQRPETPQLIWRLSRMMFEKAKHNTRAGLDAKEELLEALDIAKKGMELTEGNSKCHLWYAILLGDTCKYDDTRVKLTKGLEFERQVKMSLDIDPYNSTALHLIGRYCYEVSGIKWWEAKIAATLFGSVPQSTYDEALEYFLRADELNSEWTENTIFIAKCLVALGRKDEAKTWLDRIKMKIVEQELSVQIEELREKL